MRKPDTVHGYAWQDAHGKPCFTSNLRRARQAQRDGRLVRTVTREAHSRELAGFRRLTAALLGIPCDVLIRR